jgi:hypothetical protein
VERSDGITTALLYAVHMLGIPVRLGVDRVAKSQAFFWSVRHSLAGLDCAILLAKWCTKISATMLESPLSGKFSTSFTIKQLSDLSFQTVKRRSCTGSDPSSTKPMQS